MLNYISVKESLRFLVRLRRIRIVREEVVSSQSQRKFKEKFLDHDSWVVVEQPELETVDFYVFQIFYGPMREFHGILNSPTKF